MSYWDNVKAFYGNLAAQSGNFLADFPSGSGAFYEMAGSKELEGNGLRLARSLPNGNVVLDESNIDFLVNQGIKERKLDQIQANSGLPKNSTGFVDEAIQNAKKKYTIQQGDTLWDLANQMKAADERLKNKNTTDLIGAIAARNKIKDPNMILAGANLDLSGYY